MMNEHAIYIKKFFIAYNKWKPSETEISLLVIVVGLRTICRDLLLQVTISLYWQPNSVTKWHRFKC